MNVLNNVYRHSIDKSADTVSAFILCGGQSQRMGTDKASLVIDNQRFLDITKRTARQAGVDKTFSVGREGSDIVDKASFQGPGAALIGALQYYLSNLRLETANREDVGSLEHVLVLPVDMPLLRPELLARLLNQALTLKRSVHFNGECFPLVLYDIQRYKDALKTLLITRNSPSIRAVIDTVDAKGIDVPEAFSQALLNVNTPQEYALIS